MASDPYASGDVGLIPGILVILLGLWTENAHGRQTSKAESRAILTFGSVVIALVLVPFYFVFGLLVIAVAVWVSPVVEFISGFDLHRFVRAHIWVDGHDMSFVWIMLIGMTPSVLYLAYSTITAKFRRKEHEN